MEFKVPGFNSSHGDQGVRRKRGRGRNTCGQMSTRSPGGRMRAHLQQLQVCRLCLGGHQLRQHLRHHAHVPTHHLQLAAQLPNLKHTIGPGERGRRSGGIATHRDRAWRDRPWARCLELLACQQTLSAPGHSPALRDPWWVCYHPPQRHYQPLPSPNRGAWCRGRPGGKKRRVNAPHCTAGRLQNLLGPRAANEAPGAAPPKGRGESAGPIPSLVDGILSWSWSALVSQVLLRMSPSAPP